MNAKKFLGVKSSTASSTNASSAVSSMSSASSFKSETPVDDEEVDQRTPVRGKEKSILEKNTPLTQEDIDDAPMDALLQTASTLNEGETTSTVMPKRKSSIFSARSRATGSISADGLIDASTEQRSERSSRGRKSSMLVINEISAMVGAAAIGKSPAQGQVAPA